MSYDAGTRRCAGGEKGQKGDPGESTVQPQAVISSLMLLLLTPM